MKEITNGTLILLIVGAIVVSVAGTLVSLNKLSQFSGYGLTGMISNVDSGTATANLTIASSNWINVSDTIIELGTIDVGKWNDSDTVEDWWVVQNDGSVNISIEIYNASYQSAKGAGPFTGLGGCMDDNSCFMVRCKNSTYPQADCNTTFGRLNSAAGQIAVITDLSNLEDNDIAYFGVNVTVPESEPAGLKTQTVMFKASAS